MNNIEAVIFDLDGTLIDSMNIWAKIDEEYLGNFGLTVPEKLQEEITHLTLTETALYFKENFNIENTIEDIISTWHDMAFYHYSNTIKLKDGVIPYLKSLKDMNIKIALATSNSVPLLEATLKNNGIYDYFDAITTTEEVKKSKDNPDIYLLSAKKLNVSPERCLVFEDIVQAVNGAKLAGMKVYSVYDESSKSQKEELIRLSDKYILTFNELL
ncbi:MULTISPECIES: HAD family phosphatase [Clostridium]|jgi:HAD superfamily hydrolase (TIGR01509 family)|uniref:HAD family hydrolase n=1 Tax=Clostridium sartagoforme AAU1 TaxID=1202534 RepID=R9C773_9CLOT|nr:MULTISPECIES: HAD family phosphatase [Clostridium]EOR25167.1 HAD family hydrolase [Clostridium sartagoforme AAU1]KLE14483.1 HAD family hydrolase [Clostridium sp. C8]